LYLDFRFNGFFYYKSFTDLLPNKRIAQHIKRLIFIKNPPKATHISIILIIIFYCEKLKLYRKIKIPLI